MHNGDCPECGWRWQVRAPVVQDCPQCGFRIEEFRLRGEVERLQHIIGVLKYHIASAHQQAMVIDANTRIEGGRLEVWCIGEWVDVEKANADAAIDGEPGDQCPTTGE